MNEFQKTYAKAKAMYDTAKAHRQAYLDKHQQYQEAKLLAYQRHQTETEESEKAMLYTCEVEIEADTKFDLNDLGQCLGKSQRILLEEYEKYMTSLPHCPEEVKQFFKDWKAKTFRSLKQIQALVDIAMKTRSWQSTNSPRHPKRSEVSPYLFFHLFSLS